MSFGSGFFFLLDMKGILTGELFARLTSVVQLYPMWFWPQCV